MRTILLRLTLSHLLVAVISLVVLSLLSPWLFRFHYMRAEKERLGTAVSGLSSAAARLWERPTASRDISVLVQNSAAVLGGDVSVVSTDGTIIATSNTSPQAEPGILRDFARHRHNREGDEVILGLPTGPDTFTYSAPVFAGQERLGLVLVQRRDPAFNTALQSQRSITLAATAAGCLLAVILAFILSRALSSPLVSMAEAASRMADEDFAVQIPVEGPKETRSLAQSLNQMAATLSQAFHELAEERRLLADLIAGTSEGIVGIDGDGRIMMANAAACEMLEVPCEDGALFAELVDAEWVHDALVTAGGGPPFVRRVVMGERVLSLSVARVAGRGAVIVISDVTEDDRLARLRREFVANASHELRAPLTSIRGFLSACLDGTATGEEKEHCLRTAAAEAARMTRIVEDLLQLSRLQAGVLEFDFHPCRLEEVVSGVINGFQPRLVEKQLAVALDMPQQLPQLHIDGERIAQVIVNLLDNAVRYNPSRSTIDVQLDYDVKAGRVWLAVRDRGPGIPQEALSEVFERFHKADAGRPRTDPGAGLGLAITREIVRAHGGDTTADNHPQGGARVGFWLPLSPENT